MSKKDLIYALVGFILVLGLALGLVVSLTDNKSLKESDKITETTAPDSSNSTGVATGATTLNYYCEDGVGYSREGNVTTFFFVLPIESVFQEDADVDSDKTNVGKKFTSVTFQKGGNINDKYEGNSCQLKKSIDGGKTWSDMNYGLDSMAGEITYIDYFSPGTELYVGCVTVENCSNPMSYLTKFKTDFLGDKVSDWSSTYGAFCSYENFSFTLHGSGLY